MPRHDARAIWCPSTVTFRNRGLFGARSPQLPIGGIQIDKCLSDKITSIITCRRVSKFLGELRSGELKVSISNGQRKRPPRITKDEIRSATAGPLPIDCP